MSRDDRKTEGVEVEETYRAFSTSFFSSPLSLSISQSRNLARKNRHRALVKSSSYPPNLIYRWYVFFSDLPVAIFPDLITDLFFFFWFVGLIRSCMLGYCSGIIEIGDDSQRLPLLSHIETFSSETRCVFVLCTPFACCMLGRKWNWLIHCLISELID